MVSPAVIVEGWVGVKTFAGEQFPTNLSAGALAVKANHKGTFESRAPAVARAPVGLMVLGG